MIYAIEKVNGNINLINPKFKKVTKQQNDIIMGWVVAPKDMFP